MPNIYFVTGYDSYNNVDVLKCLSEKKDSDNLANTLTNPNINAFWYENEKDLIKVFNLLLGAKK